MGFVLVLRCVGSSRIACALFIHQPMLNDMHKYLYHIRNNIRHKKANMVKLETESGDFSI